GALVRLVITRLGDRPGIDTSAGTLRVHASAATIDHRVLPISPSGLAALRRLSKRPGEVVTKESLLDVLPGDSDDPHTAEVVIARLRQAAGEKPLVRTIVKRGYSLAVGENLRTP
ncbi:MAG: uroporphyrinogen-III synthase, partial [Myxococcales bacterium]